MTLSELFQSITNAVRGKTLKTDKIEHLKIPDEINEITTAEMMLQKTISNVKTNVGAIPEYAFYNQTSLKTVNMPNVESIGTSAFSGCTSLKSVISSCKVTNLPTSMFTNCSNLTDLQIFGEEAESGVLHITTGTSIGSNVFAGCKAFKKLIIDEGVTLKSENQFSNMTGLKEVILPSDLTAISSYMFRYLNVDTLELPASVVKLYTQCFRYSHIGKLIIRNTDSVITMISSDVFWESDIAKGIGYIYVPDALVEDYKSATNWITYANQIKGISELESEVTE